MKSAADIAHLLRCHVFHYGNEYQLQEAIQTVLSEVGLKTEREVRCPTGRFDLLVEDQVVIEVKVASSAGDVLRQLQRYAPHCEGIILVTNRLRHGSIPRCLEMERDGNPHVVPVEIVSLTASKL